MPNFVKRRPKNLRKRIANEQEDISTSESKEQLQEEKNVTQNPIITLPADDEDISDDDFNRIASNTLHSETSKSFIETNRSIWDKMSHRKAQKKMLRKSTKALNSGSLGVPLLLQDATQQTNSHVPQPGQYDAEAMRELQEETYAHNSAQVASTYAENTRSDILQNKIISLNLDNEDETMQLLKYSDTFEPEPFEATLKKTPAREEIEDGDDGLALEEWEMNALTRAGQKNTASMVLASSSENIIKFIHQEELSESAISMSQNRKEQIELISTNFHSKFKCELQENYDQSLSQMKQAKSDLEKAKILIDNCNNQKSNLQEKVIFFVKLKNYFTIIAAMLAEEKLSLINTSIEESVSAWAKRGWRKDTKAHNNVPIGRFVECIAEVADSGYSSIDLEHLYEETVFIEYHEKAENSDPEIVYRGTDTFGRDLIENSSGKSIKFYVSEARKKKRLVQKNILLSNCNSVDDILDGYETSDSDEDVVADFTEEIEHIENFESIFLDASEEYTNLEHILLQFSTWRSKFEDEYMSAFASISLYKLCSPFVRAHLINWNPILIPHLDDMRWYQQLNEFTDNTTTRCSQEDSLIVPKIMIHVVVPLIQKVISVWYDPLSMKSTRSVRLLIIDAFVFAETLDETEKVKKLLHVLLDRTKKACMRMTKILDTCSKEKRVTREANWIVLRLYWMGLKVLRCGSHLWGQISTEIWNKDLLPDNLELVFIKNILLNVVIPCARLLSKEGELDADTKMKENSAQKEASKRLLLWIYLAMSQMDPQWPDLSCKKWIPVRGLLAKLSTDLNSELPIEFNKCLERCGGKLQKDTQ